MLFILASLLQIFWSSGEPPGANLMQVKLNNVEYWNIWMSEDVQGIKKIPLLHHLKYVENVIKNIAFFIMFYKGVLLLGSPNIWLVSFQPKSEEVFAKIILRKEVEHCPAVQKQAHSPQLSSHFTVLPSNLRIITEVMKVLRGKVFHNGQFCSSIWCIWCSYAQTTQWFSLIPTSGALFAPVSTLPTMASWWSRDLKAHK